MCMCGWVEGEGGREPSFWWKVDGRWIGKRECACVCARNDRAREKQRARQGGRGPPSSTIAQQSGRRVTGDGRWAMGATGMDPRERGPKGPPGRGEEGRGGGHMRNDACSHVPVAFSIARLLLWEARSTGRPTGRLDAIHTLTGWRGGPMCGCDARRCHETQSRQCLVVSAASGHFLLPCRPRPALSRPGTWRAEAAQKQRRSSARGRPANAGAVCAASERQPA